MIRAFTLLALVLAVSAHGHDMGRRQYGRDGHGIAPWQQAAQTEPEPMPPRPPGPGPMPPRPPGPGPHPGPEPMNPCQMDFFRFCAFRVDDMRNMEEILECMHNHDADLSPECKPIVDMHYQALLDFHASCDASFDKFHAEDPTKCDKTKPQSYKMCIIEHLSGMGTGCLDEISKIMMAHMHDNPAEPAAGFMPVPDWADMRMGGGMGGDDSMASMHHVMKAVFCAALMGAAIGLVSMLVARCCARFCCKGHMCRRMHMHQQWQQQQPVAVAGLPVEGEPVTWDTTKYSAFA